MKKKNLEKEKSCGKYEKPTFAEFSSFCQERQYWICLKDGEVERLYNALNERDWETISGQQPKSWQTLTSSALFRVCGEMPSGLLFEIPTRKEFDDFCRNKIGGIFLVYPKAFSRVWYYCENNKWAFSSKNNLARVKNWQDYVLEKFGHCKDYLIRSWKEESARRVEIDNNKFAYKLTHKHITDVDLCNTDKHYVCYTDGSCDNLSKPHAGGSAYIVLKDEDVVHTASYGTTNTTNNRMEMLAIISAAYYCPPDSIVDIYSDSQYAIKVLSGEWKHKTNGDLFQKFVECTRHLSAVRFFWVKGHNGDKYNELADELAYGAYCDKCKELGIKPSSRH